MRKVQIKVIKKINSGLTENTMTVTNLSKNESNKRGRMGNKVKDWISARRENSRIEKLYSESKILTWQMPDSKLTEKTK